MKKEETLNSLLTNAEKIDSYEGCTFNHNFVYSFAVLKINTFTEEVDPEYEIYKNSDISRYKRVHAYIVDKDGEDLLYIFKNSTPERVKYVSQGDDSDLFSERLKRNLIYTIGLGETKKPKSEDGFFNYYKISLNDSKDVGDIDERREYVLENIRKNKDNQTVCWHIYPYFENGKMILNILEHNNPNELRLANIVENDLEKGIHYLPLDKDEKNWKNDIKT